MSIKEMSIKDRLSLWANRFLSSVGNEYTSEDHDWFVQNIILAEAKEVDNPGIEEHFMYKLISKRADYFGLKLNNYVKACLLFLTTNPGNAIMYLMAIKWFMVEANEPDRIIDMQYLLTEVFPSGFPTKEKLSTLWDEQKLDGGSNLVDQPIEYLFNKVEEIV